MLGIAVKPGIENIETGAHGVLEVSKMLDYFRLESVNLVYQVLLLLLFLVLVVVDSILKGELGFGKPSQSFRVCLQLS